MRIVINGMFWQQPTVGSGQYVHGLLEGLQQVAPEHEYVLLLPAFQDERPKTNDQRQAEDTSSFVRRPSSVVLHTPFDRRNENLAKLWFEQVSVPQAARRLHADLLHVPYAAPPRYSPVPVVTTIHDIIWWLLTEYRGSRAARAYFRLIPPAARRAAHILADSDHSRRDIIEHFGIAPERLTTVLLAAGSQYHARDKAAARREVSERYGIPAPFVYYVGGLDARKNVPTLLRAWARLRAAGGPAATLAVAGRALGGDSQLFPDIDALIAELGIGDSVRRIDVPRADNPLLYSAATVFAFPSRYEGFGLGPLEAMACGTPVVVAEASSLPEVVGDAALRVPPDDIAGWTTALWRLLADTQLREDLRQRGLQRARQFSYERVARETLAVYEQVSLRR
jgi:glycosyltransferase involved in cell wall biosynthesis